MPHHDCSCFIDIFSRCLWSEPNLEKLKGKVQGDKRIEMSNKIRFLYHSRSDKSRAASRLKDRSVLVSSCWVIFIWNVILILDN